ncbi:hypothetical protein L3Q82_024329 [Scortum barcoo]|uniref:Uncharacterized protein n=1 Tax=Scortum barcoo TaxID=214431 RepID=A0ACB8WWF2_9TELE|nr:hypothetical protein L3Q82_024329 [Scortum barcoo]
MSIPWMLTGAGGEWLRLRKSTTSSLVLPALIWRLKGARTCSLRSTSAAEKPIRLKALHPHKLWSVCEVVQNPCSEVMIQPQLAAACPQQPGLDGVECTGEIKEHDPHSASSLLQVSEGGVKEVDDGIIHPDVRLVGELQRVHEGAHQRAQMGEDQSLQRLHQMRRQSYRPVAVELLGVRCLWHWDDAGRLPELWHSPQLQAQVECVPKNPTQLVCAGLQEPGADAIRTCCFPGPVLLQGIPHLVCCEEQAGAGRC